MENDLHATLNSPLAESARQITESVWQPLDENGLEDIVRHWADRLYSVPRTDVMRLLATVRHYQRLWLEERRTVREVRAKLLEVRQLIGEDV